MSTLSGHGRQSNSKYFVCFFYYMPYRVEKGLFSNSVNKHIVNNNIVNIVIFFSKLYNNPKKDFKLLERP